jgi:hypothetical protein
MAKYKKYNLNTRGVLSIGGNAIPVELTRIEYNRTDFPTFELLAFGEFDLDKCNMIPAIERVIFNDPATVVKWRDGTKTIVKCQDGDTYSKETGLALCIAKKALGNTGKYNEIFRQWIEG